MVCQLKKSRCHALGPNSQLIQQEQSPFLKDDLGAGLSSDPLGILFFPSLKLGILALHSLLPFLMFYAGLFEFEYV